MGEPVASLPGSVRFTARRPHKNHVSAPIRSAAAVNKKNQKVGIKTESQENNNTALITKEYHFMTIGLNQLSIPGKALLLSYLGSCLYGSLPAHTSGNASYRHGIPLFTPPRSHTLLVKTHGSSFPPEPAFQ